MRMPILPLLVVMVGVAYAKYVVSHDNDAVLQPIVTPSQARRICAELCSSGLGGEPCGDACLETVPQGLPLQYPSQTEDTHNTTSRRDACPILCSNRLGYPMCQCNAPNQDNYLEGGKFEIDFLQICSYFCLKHNYRLNGCQTCKVYKKTETQYGGQEGDVFGFKKSVRGRGSNIDWEKWCKEQCLAGQGGVACNCDILPFAAIV